LTATNASTAGDHPAKAVAGYPADIVIWAIDDHGISQRPDLVVSGINLRENIGPFAALSGTVGAAQTALASGIPALAVSQGVDNGQSASFSQGAKYLVAWVQAHRKTLLAAKKGRPRARTATQRPDLHQWAHSWSRECDGGPIAVQLLNQHGGPREHRHQTLDRRPSLRGGLRLDLGAPPGEPAQIGSPPRPRPAAPSAVPREPERVPVVVCANPLLFGHHGCFDDVQVRRGYGWTALPGTEGSRPEPSVTARRRTTARTGQRRGRAWRRWRRARASRRDPWPSPWPWYPG
jgi:Survival protein SurE